MLRETVQTPEETLDEFKEEVIVQHQLDWLRKNKSPAAMLDGSCDKT